MTIVVSNRHRIHFVVEGERGAFLILHHGLFGSHRDWIQAGYVAALCNDFRLIIPDARGHGRSEAPVNAEQFRLSQLADDLIAVMNELDIRNAHFVGYSLGALVGCDLIMRHPERVRLIMVGGEAPVVTEEAKADWNAWSAGIQSEGYASWARSQREAGRLAGDLQPDAERRESALTMLRAMGNWDAATADQYQVSSPITLFAAANDPACERVQSLARKFHRARFTAFSGHSHRSLFEQRETLLDGILRFIKITRRPVDGAVPFTRRAGGHPDGRDGIREGHPYEEGESHAGGADAPREDRADSGAAGAAAPESTPPETGDGNGFPTAETDKHESAGSVESSRPSGEDREEV